MNRLLLSIFLLSVSFHFGCNKAVDECTRCDHTAYLLYPDYRDCICCTGWYVKVDDDTFKVYEFPQQDSVYEYIEKNGLPVKISMSYVDTTDMCNEDFKRITCFKILD